MNAGSNVENLICIVVCPKSAFVLNVMKNLCAANSMLHSDSPTGDFSVYGLLLGFKLFSFVLFCGLHYRISPILLIDREDKIVYLGDESDYREDCVAYIDDAFVSVAQISQKQYPNSVNHHIDEDNTVFMFSRLR